VKIQEENS